MGNLLFHFTPFVWFLCHKKEEGKEKATDEIKEIKKQIIADKGLRYPSSFPKATYDVYYPTEKVKHILVWVHGGSFISGSSEGVRNFGPMLAHKGTLVYAINYAYAPEYCFPSQILQVNGFLHYLQQTLLPKEKMEGKNIFLGGDSAGANLVASYVTMMNNPQLARRNKVKFKDTWKIKGLVLFCGPYDFCEEMEKEEWKQFRKFFHYIGWAYLGKKHWSSRNEKIDASPLGQINDAFPPTYICDGKKFSFQWQGKRLVQELERRGIDVQSRFYDEMPHEFQFDYVSYPKEANQVFEDTLQFMNRVN